MPKDPGSLPQVEQTGYLLIADITGYTTYLTRSELEHAEQTLTALMELLVDQTPPPMSMAQLEGDAVLSYAIDDVMPSGHTFIETIDTIYVEFRRALELMVINTSCDSNACANIGGLDLKFFVHHGAFVEQPVFDHRQLLGSDVNLIYYTEGLLRQTADATALRADLYIDPAWVGQDVRAGLWGVGHDGASARSAYPIVEYHQEDGSAGWRVWDSDGGQWLSHPATTGHGEWATVEIVLDSEPGQFVMSVDGVSATLPVLGSETLGEVIVNMYNFGPGTPAYAMHVSGFAIGHVLPSPVEKDDCRKGGYADFGYTNQGLCIAGIVSNS